MSVRLKEGVAKADPPPALRLIEGGRSDTASAAMPVVLVNGPTLNRLLGRVPQMRECKACLAPTFDPWCSYACQVAEDGPYE